MFHLNKRLISGLTPKLIRNMSGGGEWIEMHGDLGGSPYTYKVACSLRYRRIPHSTHQLLPGGMDMEGNWTKLGFDHIKPKVIPVIKWTSDGKSMNDSTLLLKELEDRDGGHRSLYPQDPANKFIALLLEDFFDEWFVKVMFGLRWMDPKDAEWSAPFLVTHAMMGKGGDLGPLRQMAVAFASRQIERMKIVGSNDSEMLWRTLRQGAGIMEDFLMQGNFFLLGNRPSVADMALYGQMANFLVDTSTEGVIRKEFPVFYAYLKKMADLSGVDNDAEWFEVPSTAADEFLKMASETYLPYLKVNHDCVLNGDSEVSTVLWRDSSNPMNHVQPPIKYQSKCYQWLQEEYNNIEDKSIIDNILKSHNILQYFNINTSSKL